MSMTESEALAELKTFPVNCLDFKENQALQIAVDLLEQYRAIGTVEELKEAKEQYDNINSASESVALSGLCDYGTAKEAMITEIKRSLNCSLKEYQKIGTVSEFRELKEKATAKKPIDVRYFGEAGHYIGLCPTCKSGNNSEFKYCGDCGQKLQWD